MFGPLSIVIAIATCAMAILYAWYVETRAQPRYVVSPHHEERLVVLDRQAIEHAYVQQVTSLFLVWMKDNTDQPERAMRGVDNARKAYVDSIDAIERREKK